MAYMRPFGKFLYLLGAFSQIEILPTPMNCCHRTGRDAINAFTAVAVQRIIDREGHVGEDGREPYAGAEMWIYKKAASSYPAEPGKIGY